VYPFMKRITYWPQIVLGLAFSWGALMGWAAFFGRLGLPALLLYAGSIAWVIGYDTIYAHQDREDDALVGIKSTALLFGERTKPMLALFYAIAVILIGAAGFAAGAGAIFGFGLLAFAAHLCWQVVRLDIGNPDLCLAVFKSDRDAGLILFAGLLADAGLRRLVWGGSGRDEVNSVAGDDLTLAAMHDRHRRRHAWPAAQQACGAPARDGRAAAAARGGCFDMHGAEPRERLAQAAVAFGDEERQPEHAAPGPPFGDDVVAFARCVERQRQCR